MNFFEQELKKIFAGRDDIRDMKFIGGACFGKIGGDTRVRMEFVKRGSADRYEGLKASVINKNDGPVDSVTLWFEDLLGKKNVSNPNYSGGIVPYIWRGDRGVDWYVYKPTESDYKLMSETVGGYIEMFAEPAFAENALTLEEDEPEQTQGMTFGSM